MDKTSFKSALKDYYLHYNTRLNAWMQKYDIESFEENFEEARLDSHHFWASMHGISNTPLIIYNSKKLPAAYSIEDSDYILE